MNVWLYEWHGRGECDGTAHLHVVPGDEATRQRLIASWKAEKASALATAKTAALRLFAFDRKEGTQHA